MEVPRLGSAARLPPATRAAGSERSEHGRQNSSAQTDAAAASARTGGRGAWAKTVVAVPSARTGRQKQQCKDAVVVASARSGRRKSEYDRHAGASGAHLHHPNRAPWRVGLWELSAVFSLLKPAIDAIRVAGGATGRSKVLRSILDVIQ
jgi:hypothetical protein